VPPPPEEGEEEEEEEEEGGPSLLFASVLFRRRLSTRFPLLASWWRLWRAVLACSSGRPQNPARPLLRQRRRSDLFNITALHSSYY